MSNLKKGECEGMKYKSVRIVLWLFYILIFVWAGMSDLSEAKRLHIEQYYQIKWCQENNGKTEVVLKDRTRVDCLTETHAIEFDFADKIYEGMTQALHYGMMTGKKPGLVLIIEKERDRKYIERAKKIIKYFSLPIDLWEMGD